MGIKLGTREPINGKMPPRIVNTAIIIVATIFIMLIHLPHVDFHYEEAFRQSLFHVVSLATTTGFVTSDFENWAPFSRMIFFTLLFVGGCAGSTGGSIKVIRHYLLFRNGFLELKRLIHPRAVIPVRVNNKAVPPEIILNVQAFFIFYILLFLLFSGNIFIQNIDRFMKGLQIIYNEMRCVIPIHL